MTQTAERDNGVLQAIRGVVEGAGAGKVFGAPINQNGLTVLPVAKVSGGAGGGEGAAKEGHEPGELGGGFGLSAKPLGVFVLKEGSVRWHPAIDVNKIILGGQIVAVTALLVVRALIKARSRRTLAP